MLDDLVEFVFGTFVDLIPLDISAAKRRRRYRQGHRVVIRAGVSGVPGTTWTRFLVVERGHLWAALNRRAGEGLVPVPLPENPAAIVYDRGSAWRRGHSVTYEVNGTRVQILPEACDWDLLRLAITETLDDQPTQSAVPPGSAEHGRRHPL